MLLTAKVIKDGWIVSRPWAIEYFNENGKRVNKVTGYKTKKQAASEVRDFNAISARLSAAREVS